MTLPPSISLSVLFIMSMWVLQSLATVDHCITNVNIDGLNEGTPCYYSEDYDYSNMRSSIQHKCFIRNKAAYCQNLNLTEVPDDLPVDITCLYLQFNNIHRLPNNIFSRYTNLISLNLCSNSITRLYVNSFFGLHRLRKLDLKWNKLDFRNDSFPDEVFSPLSELRVLILLGNNPKPGEKYLSYPDQAFSRLISVKYLGMDGLYMPVFGSGFQKMKSLRELHLNGYQVGRCYLRGLKNESFQYLTGLTTLVLESCNIDGDLVERDAFLPLSNLKNLSLRHNEDIRIENLGPILNGLRNAKSLNTLDLHLVINRYSIGMCLESKYIKQLPKSITSLYAGENSIVAVERSLISMLPPDLRVLDVSGNQFIFGTYLQDFHQFKSLEKFKANGGFFTYNVPRIYPYNSPSPNNTVASTNGNKCNLYDEGLGGGPFIMKFPPKLKIIEMMSAGLKYRLSEWTVDPANVVENISISKNSFPALIGPIKGFNNLKHLDISSSFVLRISQHFFKHLTSLQTLNLGSNVIGRFMKKDKNCLFSSLVNLLYLDLSFNAIEHIHFDAFDNLHSLKHLNLSDNPFSSFNVNLSHMNHLELLSLSNTHISFLPSIIKTHIDTLLHSGIHVKINMSGTPIKCVCENLQFLKWMVNSPAFGNHFHNYLCEKSDFTSQILPLGYNRTLHNLNRECADNSLLFFIVGTVSTVVLITIVVLIGYQFRWKLKYLYYVAYLNLKKDPGFRKREFEYDTFICYADEDIDLVANVLEPQLRNRNLRILIHKRDFKAGEFIGSNIVEAICKSKKMLVFLTKSMLDSYWCNYEIQMANVEALQTGRQVLIFMLKDTNPQKRDHLDVFYNIKNNTYCEFPDLEMDENFLKAFWDKLASDITN